MGTQGQLISRADVEAPASPGTALKENHADFSMPNSHPQYPPHPAETLGGAEVWRAMGPNPGPSVPQLAETWILGMFKQMLGPSYCGHLGLLITDHAP